MLGHCGLWVIASGRSPERPIFVVRPDAAGDLTLPAGETANSGVAWSKNARGSYMPTPLAYKGVLYVLATTALSDGAMYVRTATSLVAIGKK